MMETAYGLTDLGLPIQGIESNSSRITSDVVNKFYLDNFTYDKIFICAAGVTNHQDFVQMIENKLDKIIVGYSNSKRKKSVYKGGVNKVFFERDEFHASLVFEAVSF